LVAQIEARLSQSAKGSFAVSRLRLQALQQQVEMLNPRATLARGYAIVRRADGTVVLSADAVEDGEALLLELRDGVLSAHASAERPKPNSHPRFPLGTEEL
jgi:exodeoxyribonuclease VII large subunit